MNYVELDLGGKKRGAKLGIGYLRHVTEVKKISLDELFKSIEGLNAVLLIPELIFLSLSYNASRKKEKFEYTLDDVFDWIDEADGVKGEACQTFINTFTQSLGADMGKETPRTKVATKK